MGKKKILILGAGFGGLTIFNYLLRTLKKRNDVRITLINEHNFFLFSPLLHEVAVGVLLPENIVTSVRKLYGKRISQFVQTYIKEINLVNHEVITSAGVYNYDYIVLALGGVTDISGMSNAKDNSHIFMLKTIRDAIAIKNHIMGMFEQASIENASGKVKQLLTFVISGAGYTGIQLAASLSDVIYKYLISIYRQIDPSNIKIIILESTDRIIRDLPVKYSIYVMRYLQSHKIEVMLNSEVTNVSDNQIEINQTDIIPSQTLLYVPGIVANPVISTLNTERDSMGRVIVNDYMGLENFNGAYAVGDCSHFQDKERGLVARPRAHIAVRQARIAAHNLVADIRGNKKKKYHYSDSSEIISLGRSNALLRVYKFWFRGILAVIVGVISYSLLAIGKKNRVIILVDWILSRIFGPDTAVIQPQDIGLQLGEDIDRPNITCSSG
ncbi:NAD(P)/FAD-dependent oxidoreductase [Chloroflexota bacterium]